MWPCGEQLSVVADGVSELKSIALNMRDEVKVQSAMVDEITNKVCASPVARAVSPKIPQVSSNRARACRGVCGRVCGLCAAAAEAVCRVCVCVCCGGQVDAASGHLNNINKRMKQTLAQTRSADRFILDFILLVVLLAIIGYIISLVTGSG